MSKLLELSTYVYEANHVKAEADRLLERAQEQIDRWNASIGTPQEVGIKHLAERELEAIKRQLQRGQLGLVHPADHRHASAKALLRATAGTANRTPIPAEERAEAA